MFKPTLAVAADLDKIQFPVYASCKLDGIRCSIVNGQALTRTLKAIPNKHISAALSLPHLTGLDGELILGDPCSKSVYRDTNSAVMSHDGKPDMSYFVFDLHNIGDRFFNRVAKLQELVRHLTPEGIKITALDQRPIYTYQEMLDFEEVCLNLGFEGLILRSYDSPYKFGRSTVKEGYMLKVKRFSDNEGEVVGIIEEMFNGNEAEINELGRTKRSTAAEGLVGKGTMGALVVKELDTGVVFNLGTGFDAKDRAAMWANPPIGKVVVFKHFASGRLNLPRHPVFKGFRSIIDI